MANLVSVGKNRVRGAKFLVESVRFLVHTPTASLLLLSVYHFGLVQLSSTRFMLSVLSVAILFQKHPCVCMQWQLKCLRTLNDDLAASTV